MDLFNRSGAKRKLIANLNLEPYVNRAVDDFNLKPADIDTAMREYRHFLYLAYWNRRLEQSTMVVPTVLADKIWHSHILFTRDYREMCDKVFGRYLDHNPGLKEGTSGHATAMQHTRDVHKHIRKLGKEPGFDENYFSFLDPKRPEQRQPSARVPSGSRTSAGRTARSSKRQDQGGQSDSSSGVSPAFIIDSSPHSNPQHDFGGRGGDFGGGGASGGWDNGSSSSSDSGSSGSSCGGSSCGGGGCGGGGD